MLYVMTYPGACSLPLKEYCCIANAMIQWCQQPTDFQTNQCSQGQTYDPREKIYFAYMVSNILHYQNFI
jgi:hypothetical protein